MKMEKEKFVDGLGDLSLTRRGFLKSLAAAGLLGGSLGSDWGGIVSLTKGEGGAVSLTREEEKMLSGEYGPGVQESMRLLVKIGDAYGAERMIPLKGAHIHGIAGMKIPLLGSLSIESELMEGATYKIPTSIHAKFLAYPKGIGIPDVIIDLLTPMMDEAWEVHERMGAIPINSCQPFLKCGEEKFDHYKGEIGDHYALTDTTVVWFANSWLGIRSNQESPETCVASGITGVTPEYGMHLTENRYGKVLIEFEKDLDTKEFTYKDYGVLSFFAGELTGDKIPVYNGLPKDMTWSQAKYMCTPQSWFNPAPMFHIVGVTPEAPTVEEAFGGEKPEERIVIGKKEMKEWEEEVTTIHSGEEIGLVSFGCPHCSIEEISEIAGLIKGKKVADGVKLWVATNPPIRELAVSRGYVDTIEKAGGHVNPCVCGGPMPAIFVPLLGWKGMATTSATAASMIGYGFGIPIKISLGTPKQCIKAAITGRWD